jgi:2-dehydropantoate 2-reductase
MKGRVLVYGMGVIGSVYALRLAKAGYAVTGLARGERLASLRSTGLVIHNVFLGDEETAAVEIIDLIPKHGEYDIVLVAVRSGQIRDALGQLRECRSAHAVAVIGNNLEDHAAEAKSAGEDRFVIGFGAFGGYREGGKILYVDGRTKKNPGPERRSKTTLGILSESARPALELVSGALAEAGLPTAVNPDMHAYLLYHAALVFPLAGAIYAAGGGQERFCRTRDAIVLGIRACHEACRALRVLGFQMQPKSLKSLTMMPEWFLANMLSKSLRSESARVAMFGHANAQGGRAEIGGQAAVLDKILHGSGKTLEYWKRLLPFFTAKSEADLLPDGSRSIKLRIW